MSANLRFGMILLAVIVGVLIVFGLLLVVAALNPPTEPMEYQPWLYM